MFNLRKDSFPNADPNYLRICQNQSAFANNVKTKFREKKGAKKKERKDERKKGKIERKKGKEI